MKVKAQAKVNLALDVVGLRPDGYHELDMIMAPVSLFDELEIEPSSSNSVICQDIELPACNTLSKTLELMQQEYGIGCYRVQLNKSIPSQAGLGGGSADAAALIHALDQMEGLHLSPEQKNDLGARIGADVPFCLINTLARVRGIGEKCRPIEARWSLPVLLVQPDTGVSTPACFKKYDSGTHKPKDIDIVQKALEKNNLALLYQTMENALEKPAFEMVPVLERIKEEMNDLGIVRVMMTGSGSCMMGFCVDEQVLDAACEKLKEKYPFVTKAWIGG